MLPRPWTFYITTFGCKVNQYESQAIAQAWLSLGAVPVSTPAKANIALVNSCAVTTKGERDARHACYRLHREAPSARHILTGCAASLVAARLDDASCAPCIVPARAKALLLRNPWSMPKVLPDAVPPFGPQGFCITDFARARAVVKVQDGCSHRCTYCIVPLMRGPSVSRAPQEILAEVTALMEAGFGEIILSGINLGQYGRGVQHGDFWDLLRLLDSTLAPRFAQASRLRISSLEPTQLDARGLDTLMAGRLVCPHLHLALQHGSPRVLRRMGRGHCRPERIVDAVAAMRRHWPCMGLGADIVMGFPAEEEDDVRATLHTVAALGLTYAHVFPYSARPGTAAATFAHPVPHAVKLARAQSVRQAVRVQSEQFLQRLSTLPVLHVVADVDIDHTNTVSRAVSEHYAPCRIVNTDTRTKTDRSLLRVRPVGIGKGALLVQAI